MDTPRDTIHHESSTEPRRARSRLAERIRPLFQLDNYHGPMALLEDLAVIFAGILMGMTSLDFPLPLMLIFMGMSWILVGTRQRGLATLLHESSHHTLARDRVLNHLLGTLLSGWWILQLRCVYVRSHVHRHHAHLGDPTADPDTIQYLRSGMLGQDPNSFLARNLLSMLVGAKAALNLPYLLRDRLLPNADDRYSKSDYVEMFAFLAFWSLLIAVLGWAGLLDEFLLFWVLPYLTVFQAVNWLIEVAEHFPLAWLGQTGSRASRNRKGHWFERFFFGIHAEHFHRLHHMFPRIPFWRMNAAHAVLMTEDAEYARGEQEYGGLLTSGPTGGRSIISRLPAELRAAGVSFRVNKETPPLDPITPIVGGHA